jgi:hypothetical protein
MADPGRGGGAPQTGKSARSGEHGGNRGGGSDNKRRDANGPGNDRQAQGKDPHRGQPG